MKKIKGQNLRLKINGKFVAFATDATVHVTKQVESSSTKDSDEGLWEEQEVVGKSFDLSVSALYGVGEDATGNTAEDLTALLVNTDDPVDFTFEQTEGAKNRTSTGVLLSGKVIINDGSIQATNRTDGSIQLSAQGYGKLVVGSGDSISDL